MPITPPGQSTGGSLADLLGGVDRPTLNSFVANSVARNGLVSAQTQDAMIKASQAQEQMQAWDDMKTALIKNGAKESQADLVRAAVVGANNHDPETGMKVLSQTMLGFGNPQAQVSGQQMAQGKIAGLETAPGNFVTPTAMAAANANPSGAPPPIGQTPEAAAQTASFNATAGLHANQTTNPQLYHAGGVTKLDPVQAAEVAQFIKLNPSAAGNLRGLLAGGAGPDVIHAFLHDPNAQGSSPNGIVPAAGVSLAEQAAIRKDFASGTGAKQTTYLNTLVQHSQLFDALADQLENGDSVPSNYVQQLWQRTFGSPAPTNLKTAGSFLAREAVRATVNSGAGTGDERELAVNENSSPGQLHEAASTIRSLATGQLNSLDLRARRGGVDIAQLLGPQAQAVFGRTPVNNVSTPLQAPPSGAGETPLSQSVPTQAAPAAATGLPAYPTEEAARAAGHKTGDRVMIGGVTGTLD